MERHTQAKPTACRLYPLLASIPAQPPALPAVRGEGRRTACAVTAKQDAAAQQELLRLQENWLQTCEQVAAFQQQHGRLPSASADAQGPVLPGERPLGLWCTEQQRRVAGSKGTGLSADEKRALQANPGWAWWATRRVPWEQRRQEVEAFYQQHGRLPRATAGKPSPFLPGEKELGAWVGTQRQQFKSQQLSADRIAALEAILGWCWAEFSVTAWELRVQQVDSFCQQHGRLPRTATGQKNPFLPGEKELGFWIHRQRNHYKGHMQPPLSAERVAALESIPGWSWGDCKPWGVRCQQLQDFVRQHGRLPRRAAGSSSPFLPGEKELGLWVMTQRKQYKSQRLSADQIAALVAIPGWCWEGWKEAWDLRLQQLQIFVRQHGRIPRRRGSNRMPLQPSERQLGLWCGLQRRRRKGSTHQPPLPAERQAALAAVPGWFWDEDDRWEQQRVELEAFVRQHSRLPRTYPSQKEPLAQGEKGLGNWLLVQTFRQRGAYMCSPLTAKQLAALEAIFLWCSKDGP